MGREAAELVEKVAALQAALPVSMLDDWLDHLDRMFRASFPETLIATWRTHRLDVFAWYRLALAATVVVWLVAR